MKVMFISDIHGSYYWANRAIEKYHEEKADKLIILGDILYHGPRNDLPKDYNCKKVIALLNPLKKDIVAVRGNCDSEVDQMVLDFPMRSDYALMDVDQHHFFMTHGHLFNEDQLPLLNENNINEAIRKIIVIIEHIIQIILFSFIKIPPFFYTISQNNKKCC